MFFVSLYCNHPAYQYLSSFSSHSLLSSSDDCCGLSHLTPNNSHHRSRCHYQAHLHRSNWENREGNIDFSRFFNIKCNKKINMTCFLQMSASFCCSGLLAWFSEEPLFWVSVLEEAWAQAWTASVHLDLQSNSHASEILKPHTVICMRTVKVTIQSGIPLKKFSRLYLFPL